MVKPAFRDPVFSAQSTFRAMLDAVARPGEIVPVQSQIDAPLPMTSAMAAIALAILDQDTPVWLDTALAATPEVTAWIRFHTGASIVAMADQSAFAFVREQMRLPPLDAFNLGTAEYPDRSTTVIVHVDSWDGATHMNVSGPGIKGQRRLVAGPLPGDFQKKLASNRALFPRGVDLFLASDRAVAALPRSVWIAR
jgi:alpha-D-ribose 1-methylphosphonate 5-triphosphate synthase subunit PhnH